MFSLGRRSLGSLDLYLDENRPTNISTNQLKIIRDLVNFQLGLGSSQSQPEQGTSTQKSKVFLQILFDNKGIDTIGLSSILHSAEVVSKLPSHISDRVPLVCYRYSPPVATKILNFRTESKMMKKPSSCACHSSTYTHQPLGHVITGDLSIITNHKLRDIFEKGPKFREPRAVNWPKNYELIKSAIRLCQENWAERIRVPKVELDAWAATAISKVHAKIQSLSQKGSPRVAKSIFFDKEVQKSLKDLHEKYVVTTADKAGNNIVFICKKFYHERILSELGACPGSDDPKGNSTYKVCSKSINSILQSHVAFCKQYKIDLSKHFHSLPYFHWLPKLHKRPYGSRFIAASSSCSTTIISKILTACLSLVKQRQQRYYDAMYRNSGIQSYWLIKNSDEVSQVVSDVNRRGPVTSIRTYDFSTLYTNLPHSELKERIPRLVQESFEGLNMKFISVDRRFHARWTKKPRRSWLLLSSEDVKAMLHFLLDNVFIQVGKKVFQQCIGIPMGTNCAPLLAELLLHDYESKAMIHFSRTNDQPSSFAFTRRYIDDLISINNPRFDSAISKIYPSELALKDTTLGEGEVAYLDRRIEIRDRQLVMSLYDKRDDFPFKIRNYPHLNSNIPCMPTYGVYISQLIRFTKACDSYVDFLARHQHLVSTLLNQGFRYGLLCRKFKQFYRSHFSLISRYSKSVTQHLREGIDSQV